MKNKNILFYYLAGANDGGADHSLYYLIDYLNKNRFKPFVIYKKESFLVNKIIKSNIKTFKLENIIHDIRDLHSEIDKFWHKNKVGIFLTNSNYLRKLTKIFRSKSVIYFLKIIPQFIHILIIILRYRIDIIHLNHDPKSDKVGLFAGIITGRKIICHLRGVVGLSKYDKIVANHVIKFIAISNFIKKEYTNLNLIDNKIKVVYNGVDLRNFQNNNRNYEKVDKIGFIGRLEKWKGIVTFIDSIPMVLQNKPNIKFVIAGDGKLAAQLKLKVSNMCLSDNVIFLGATDKIVEVYKNIDIFVHASTVPEPFGRVIIEAMAMGLPVISTNIGGPTEIIRNEIDGILIDPGNASLLANEIIKISSNMHLRQQLGTNATSRIIDHFDIEKTTKKIENIFNQI